MNVATLQAIALAMAFGSGAACADVLVGSNGDRVSGHVIEQSADKIVFQSDLLGRLEVPADKARIESDAPVVPAPTSAVVARPVDKTAGPWSFDIGAKLNLDRGSLKTPEDKLDTNLVLVRRTADGELHANVTYQYKSTAAELRDDDWLGSIGYDHFISERRFLAGRATGTRELTSEGYDSTATVSVAGGWRLWEAPDHFLRIGPAIGYLALTRGDQRFDGPALGLYARAMTPLLGRARLTGELQLLDSLSDGRYASLELRIRQPLGERLYLAMGWNYVWSDFAIESGITSEWRWDIGWRFGPTEPK
jgi:hypothetical protein